MLLSEAIENKKLKIVSVNGYVHVLKRLGLSEAAFCTLVYKRKNLYVLSLDGERLAVGKKVACNVEVEYV